MELWSLNLKGNRGRYSSSGTLQNTPKIKHFLLSDFVRRAFISNAFSESSNSKQTKVTNRVFQKKLLRLTHACVHWVYVIHLWTSKIEYCNSMNGRKAFSATRCGYPCLLVGCFVGANVLWTLGHREWEICALSYTIKCALQNVAITITTLQSLDASCIGIFRPILCAAKTDAVKLLAVTFNTTVSSQRRFSVVS